MTQPVGFNIQINEDPQNGAMCDVCTSFIVSGTKRISTFIGTSPQSNVCWDCATNTAALIRPDPMAKARAAKAAKRLETVSEAVAV